MRKSTVTVTLALLGPTLVAGCSSRGAENGTQSENQVSNRTTRRSYGSGGFFGRIFRGGFGSIGRGFSGGS